VVGPGRPDAGPRAQRGIGFGGLARRRTELDGGDTRDPRDLLEELELNIERLKGLYEQYFRGIEKVPPVRMLERVERSVRNLQRGHRLKTVQRFKLQGLQARLVTYKHYWKRILTQMENGTYRRDVNRANRRQAAIEEAAARTEARMEEASGEGTEDAAAADRPERARRPRPSSGTTLPEGVTAGEVRALFKDLRQGSARSPPVALLCE
jgi:hypothetical protein